MIIEIGEVDDNSLMTELLSNVELGQADDNNGIKLVDVLITSSAVLPGSISFIRCGGILDSVSLFPFIPTLLWIPAILVRFFTMVSPSAVIIFFGHRFNLVCLIRPFR